MTNTEVHQSHCCALHGCKYSDFDCPVTSLVDVQEYDCEFCDVDPGEIREWRLEIDAGMGGWRSVGVRVDVPTTAAAVSWLLEQRKDAPAHDFRLGTRAVPGWDWLAI